MEIEEAERTAKELRIGSKELDRMKWNIITTVGILNGLASQPTIRRGEFHVVSAVPMFSGDWNVSGSHGRESIRITYRNTREVEPVFTASHPHAMDYRYIEEVHNALPYLVALIAKSFPEMEERWKPFLLAAKARDKEQVLLESHETRESTVV